MRVPSSRLLLLSLVLAAAAFLPRAEAAPPVDEWITAMIKLELWTAPGVPSMDVYVDTVEGQVVLSGKVETLSERQAAEDVAQKIKGVTKVRNLLQVVPPRAEKAVGLADKEIEAGVKRAFSSERALANTEVGVASVSNGLVLLTGKARTLSEHLVAIETARLVKGVRSVATQVKGPSDLSDDELADGNVTRAGRDVYITAAVKLRLFADRAVPSLDVSVDARHGMVVLFGTVPTEGAKVAAEREARKVPGVDRVLNDLQVVPAADRKVVAAKDEVVNDSVKKAFEAREDLKKVDVKVKNGVVRLTGTVHSVPAKLRASVLARSTTGVERVENDVRVKLAD